MSRLRIRSLKPDAWTDEAISGTSRDARLLFVVLITFADDDGRFRDLPAQIIGHGYAEDHDVTAKKITAWMNELITAGVIVRYEVAGKWYATFPKWHKHQHINRWTPSDLPRCPLSVCAVIVRHKDDADPVNTHGELTENSRRTHGELTESSRPDWECGEGSVENPLTPASGGTRTDLLVVGDPAPLKPSGARKRDAEAFDARMASWAAAHFPGADPAEVASVVGFARKRPGDAVTASEVRAYAERRGAMWVAMLDPKEAA